MSLLHRAVLEVQLPDFRSWSSCNSDVLVENVLAESRMMIPDCQKRLETSLADLKGTLAELEEANPKEGPEIDEARSTIADVEHVLQTTKV